jgi:anti-sigma factor ChrR (cupin superfamily)
MDTTKMPWQQLRENVLYKPLAKDKSRNFQIDIMKLEPNITYKEHIHPDIEWIYILKGSMEDEKGAYKAGDFFINEKNSKHIVKSGENGCELLCCWCGKVIST